MQVALANRARAAYPFDLPSANELPKPLLEYLEAMFVGDADFVQKINSIQEHMGACIACLATKYERAMLLVGPRDWGKSRLMMMFRAAMPPGAISHLPLHLMGDQYAPPRMVGSHLNVVADLPNKQTIPSAVKGIISGEGVTCRNPGSAAVDLIPLAGQLFGITSTWRRCCRRSSAHGSPSRRASRAGDRSS